MKSLNNQENDRIRVNNMNEEKWVKHYRQLWYDENAENATEGRYIRGFDDLVLTELTEACKATKNKKAIGVDDINAELWKYDGLMLYIRRLYVYNKCWKFKEIPDDWRRAKVISLFKKGDRNNPQNYRGISLLDTAYKIYARIINKLHRLWENFW